MNAQPPAPTYATNAQIDEAVLELIRCNGPISTANVAANIYAALKLRPFRPLGIARPWTAGDYTSASCQRLEQRGLVKFDKGWRVAK